ncbi:MAG: NAD(P)/FAD-dependent oxidoreductase [Paracoccaceae bacterium]
MTCKDQKSTIVIGAGLSGLAAAKALRSRGIPVTVLDASPRIADTWRARHPQLRLNIHRHFARLPGQEMTKTDGIYIRRDTVVEFLTEYAEKLDTPILHDTKVTGLERDSDGWCVTSDKGEFRCSNVIIATGRERLKTIPDWPGIECFQGQVIHSADLGDVTRFDGKNVLVIGAGNSGTDVLNHLSRSNPAQVWVSVRHGPAILPSRIFGFPLQRLANVFSAIPRMMLDPAFAIIQRYFIGDLRRYGLRRHTDGGGTRMLRDGITFGMDDGFVQALKGGRFLAVSETVKFYRDGVELKSGRIVHPDVVICATGYTPGLGELLDGLNALDTKGYPLCPMGQADPDNPGLWFTGYGVIFQGFFHAAGISAQRIATAIDAQPANSEVAYLDLKSKSGPPLSSHEAAV